MRKILVAVNILLLSLFLACATANAAVFTDNQTVDKNKDWTITFSQPVCFDADNLQNITVTNTDGQNVNVSVIPGNNETSVIVKAPAGGYNPGTYILTIGKNLHSLSNVALKSEVIMHFSVAAEGGETSDLDSIMEQLVTGVNAESGFRVNGQVPYAYRLPDCRIRLYYHGNGGITSALSSDGLSFDPEQSTCVNQGVNPTVVEMPDGKIRMYFNRIEMDPRTNYQIHKIYSALSTDGIHFTDEGLCFEPSSVYANYTSVPEAIVLPDGRVRVYYITDNKTGEPKSAGSSGVGSSISSDGRSFTRELGNRIDAEDFCDPSIIKLANGYYLMINDHNEAVGAYSQKGVYGSLSRDGLNFSKPVLICPDSTVHRVTDPSVAKVNDNTYRVYYWQLHEDEEHIKSFTFNINPEVLTPFQ